MTPPQDTYLSLLESSMPWGDTRDMGGVRATSMDRGGPSEGQGHGASPRVTKATKHGGQSPEGNQDGEGESPRVLQAWQG